jgi:hypothetical protein
MYKEGDIIDKIGILRYINRYKQYYTGKDKRVLNSSFTDILRFGKKDLKEMIGEIIANNNYP